MVFSKNCFWPGDFKYDSGLIDDDDLVPYFL